MLGLRLKISLLGLSLLALTSYGIEIIQPYFNRNREFFDAWANTAGICIGAGLGFTLRVISSYIWTELYELRMNRHLKMFKQGSILVTEGSVLDKFFIIKRGMIQLSNDQWRATGSTHSITRSLYWNHIRILKIRNKRTPLLRKKICRSMF